MQCCIDADHLMQYCINSAQIMYSDMKAEADEKEMQQNAQYSIDEIDNDSKIDQNNQKEGLDVEKS